MRRDESLTAGAGQSAVVATEMATAELKRSELAHWSGIDAMGWCELASRSMWSARAVCDPALPIRNPVLTRGVSPQPGKEGPVPSLAR
jgi:hypothetical protein